jgi:hypothetical protein
MRRVAKLNVPPRREFDEEVPVLYRDAPKPYSDPIHVGMRRHLDREDVDGEVA